MMIKTNLHFGLLGCLWLTLLGATFLSVSGCKTMQTPRVERPFQSGIASCYHDGLAGQLTANGEKYNPNALTCAHRTLPLGTEVEVYSVRTKQRVICRINDRGPYVAGRILDMSRATAEALDLSPHDLAKVEVRIMKPEN